MQSLSMIIFADGRCGLNLWVRKMEYDGKKIDQIMYVNQYRSSYRNLGGKNTAAMKPGERIIISTPGGGGYGPLKDLDEEEQKRQKKNHARDMWRGTGSIANYQAIQESA